MGNFKNTEESFKAWAHDWFLVEEHGNDEGKWQNWLTPQGMVVYIKVDNQGHIIQYGQCTETSQ